MCILDGTFMFPYLKKKFPIGMFTVSFPLFCLPFLPVHPVCYLSPIPEPLYPPTYPPEDLLARISLATQQDEDGDTYVDLFKMT